MMVVIKTLIAHQCPHVDENDIGTAIIEWPSEAPELHGVRRFLDLFHTRKMTHEQLTDEIAGEYPTANVTTQWTTAGMEVECVVPRNQSV